MIQIQIHKCNNNGYVYLSKKGYLIHILPEFVSVFECYSPREVMKPFREGH